MENWLQGMDGFSYCMEMPGSGVWFLYFSEKKKWILDQNGNQHRNSIPGKPVDLSIFYRYY